MKAFTPVCTTEMIAFSNTNTYFNKINTCLIGLSIDSNPSHLAWVYDIYCKTGIVIPFPIIADRSGEIARKYGMISSSISNTSTVRNVFIIDDKQIVRTILVYPMNIGRNIPEILRIVKALQVSDENNQMAPANWMPCDPMIVPMPETYKTLTERLASNKQNGNNFSWYLSFKNPVTCNNNISTGLSANNIMNRTNPDLQINNSNYGTLLSNYMSTNNIETPSTASNIGNRNIPSNATYSILENSKVSTPSKSKELETKSNTRTTEISPKTPNKNFPPKEIR